MDEIFFTPNEVAKKFKVTRQAVNKWVREGKLKAVKLSSLWRIPESSLQEFIKSNQGHKKEQE